MAQTTSPMAVILTPAYDHDDYQSAESLGLQYVTAALEREGVLVEVLDECRCPLDAEVLKKIESTLLVGIGILFTRQIPDAVIIAEEIRSRFPRVHITVGGQGISFLWGKILRHCDAIDSACVFESDETIVDLWRQIFVGSTADCVTGIYHRQGSRIHFNGYREPPSPDRLPHPYRSPRSVYPDHHTTICSSRGCVAHCSYCQSGNYGNRYHKSGRWRCRSPRDVVDEIAVLSERLGIRSVSFVDDDFLGGDARGRERALEIAALMHASGMNVTFSIGCRADEITFDLLNELKRAGLRHVLIGVESGNPSDIELYAKRIDRERAKESLRTLRVLEINVSIGFIMFHPESTLDNISTNIDFLDENDLPTYRAMTNRLEMYPGSPLIDYFSRRKTSFREISFRLYYDFKHPDVSVAYESMRNLLRPFRSMERRIEELSFLSDTHGATCAELSTLVRQVTEAKNTALVDCAWICLEYAGSPDDKPGRLTGLVNDRINTLQYSFRNELGNNLSDELLH
jgi:anaerobic magnesium-protoporphyrin IX monomethyl ester cyclase